MIKELKETYPGINIVGYHCPPIQEISKFKSFYIDLLDNVEADIVCLLGFPKTRIVYELYY